MLESTGVGKIHTSENTVPQNAGNFLSGCVTVSFSRRAQPHEHENEVVGRQEELSMRPA
jgi:hypothetical protein